MAGILSGVTLALLIWLVIIVPLPLCVTVCLLGAWLRCLRFGSLLVSSFQGRLVCFSDGRIDHDGQVYQMAGLLTNLAQWVLVVKLSDGSSRLLWRDSCDQRDYCQLIINERQRQNASV